MRCVRDDLGMNVMRLHVVELPSDKRWVFDDGVDVLMVKSAERVPGRHAVFQVKKKAEFIMKTHHHTAFLLFMGTQMKRDELLSAGASCLFKVRLRLSRSAQVGRSIQGGRPL